MLFLSPTIGYQYRVIAAMGNGGTLQGERLGFPHNDPPVPLDDSTHIAHHFNRDYTFADLVPALQRIAAYVWEQNDTDRLDVP